MAGFKERAAVAERRLPIQNVAFEAIEKQPILALSQDNMMYLVGLYH